MKSPTSAMQIRNLDPIADLALVAQMYEHARDYWALDRTLIDTTALAHSFFNEAPPNCDPAASDHLGLFLDGSLAGVAELSRGFPDPTSAYLGTLILADWARGQGHGTMLLRHIESRSRAQHCTNIFLGVLDANPKGRAFWLREGFSDTGLSRVDTDNGITNTIRRLGKPL